MLGMHKYSFSGRLDCSGSRDYVVTSTKLINMPTPSSGPIVETETFISLLTDVPRRSPANVLWVDTSVSEEHVATFLSIISEDDSLQDIA
jgi:hypothetical protein